MRVLKRILISLGGVLLAAVALFAVLGLSSAHFKSEQEPFVRAFVYDLSKRWMVSEVYDRLAQPFIEQAATVQGQQQLQQFKQLGAVKTVRDLKLRNYNASPTSGQTGVFSFNGIFENGDAAVDVIINKRDGTVSVLAVHVASMHLRAWSSQALSS